MDMKRFARDRARSLGTLALVALLALQAPARAAVVRVFTICPTKESVIVCWESDAGGEAVVKYGTGGRMDRKVTAQPYATHPNARASVGGKQMSYTAHLYKAALKGLKPGTKYDYQVQAGGGTSGRCSFTTGPKKVDKLTFIAYGDSRHQADVHKRLADQFASHKPAFIMHCGDFVHRARKYDRWNSNFFGPARGILAQVPLVPTKGNHEKSFEAFKKVLPIPDDEMPGAYWLEYSDDLHILILRDTYKKDYVKWADAKLSSSRAKWKLAMGHYPGYNMGGHTEIWGYHCGYNRLFSRYGVDIYFGGDSHQYERFVPVTPYHEKGSHVVTYITTAGGGAGLYDIGRNELLAKTAKVHHYVVGTIEGNKLTLKAIDMDGREFDRHVITKNDDGTVTDEYRASAKPEEALIVSVCIASKEARRGNLYAKLSGTPSPDTEVTMSFDVESARLDRRDEVELTVRLSPESAKSYEMIPAELTAGRLPVLEAFTTKLKSKVPVRKGRALDPPLIIECEYKLIHNGKVYYTGKTWTLPLK